MSKRSVAGWLPMFLVAFACAPANKVAEELYETGTTDTEWPSSTPSDTETANTELPSSTSYETETTDAELPSTDQIVDAGTADYCHAGGGDQPCSAVRACEAGCNNNRCMVLCGNSLCTAHEKIYCDMVYCRKTYCETACQELENNECLACIYTACSEETTTCSSASVCSDE